MKNKIKYYIQKKKKYAISKGIRNPIKDFQILWQYKKLNPNKLKLLNSNNSIYVNPRDTPGRILLRLHGNKRLINFWLKAVELNPSIVIDVGVNYGECLFSAIYPNNTRIIGIEPNIQLIQHIKKSKQIHPNKDQIEIIHALASNENHDDNIFYVDKVTSSESSVSLNDTQNQKEIHKVKSITLNSLFTEFNPNEILLFKIDVEGHEPFVLQGMKHLFDEIKIKLGIIEFDSEFMEKTNVNVDDYLEQLGKYFHICCYDNYNHLVKLPSYNLNSIKKLFNSDYIHTDLVLVTDLKLLNTINVDVIDLK